MEDWEYGHCEVHGNVAWEADRPWNAFWCCEGEAELDEGLDMFEDSFE